MRYCPCVWEFALSKFPAMQVEEKNEFTGETQLVTKPASVWVYSGIVQKTNKDCDGSRKANKNRFAKLGLSPCFELWDSENKRCKLGTDEDLELTFLSKVKLLEQEMKERGVEVKIND